MMRHGKKIHRLGRPADQRKALLRALTTAILTHGAIKTTKEKAKAVRPWVDKMILLAKEGGDAKRKQVNAWVYDETVVDAIFAEAPGRYSARGNDFTKMETICACPGGGSRERPPSVTHSRLFFLFCSVSRRGDNANMVTLELI
jgi:large subunit ribosomal protein L17